MGVQGLGACAMAGLNGCLHVPPGSQAAAQLNAMCLSLVVWTSLDTYPAPQPLLLALCSHMLRPEVGSGYTPSA